MSAMPSPRRSLRSFFVVRSGLGLALGVLLGTSCNLGVESVFTCLADEDCVAEGGMGGVCEPNNLCTFPDMACPSGKRWHSRAAELADKCYEPSDLGGGGTETAAGTGPGTGTDTGMGSEESSSSSGGGATTLPSDDTADGSSSSPPPVTDDGATTTGGVAGSCGDVFGTAPGYVECEDNADNCMFNVMLGMTSCNDLCATFGATCIEGFTNAESGCTTDGMLPCDDTSTNESICRCTKP